MTGMIVLDVDLVSNLTTALTDSQKLIEKSQHREEALRTEADANRLLTEAEAGEYLGRSSSGLQYYRQMGLDYYKKGKEIWYRKGDIDAWLQTGKVARHSRQTQ